MHAQLTPNAVKAMGLALALSSCTVGPRLTMPDAANPSAFKGGSSGQTVDRPDWWTVFGDSTLSSLVQQIDDQNLTLRAALARTNQAYAALGVERGALFPAADLGGFISRNRNSGADLGGNFLGGYNTQYRSSLGVGWEIDLWGRVRSLVESRKAEAEAAGALENDVKLALQAQLVRSYHALRFLDEERRVLQAAVATREQNLKLAEDRFRGGLTSELDVARAETELATTRAELARLQAPRTKSENAIAVLVGRAPSDFELAPRKARLSLPQVRSGLPMEALSHRPDIAATQQTLRGANAEVGVAIAEFLPLFSLTGSGGLSSISSTNFLQWSSRQFNIGPEVSLPLFQGGRLRSGLKRARARHEEAVADYQQTVLEALREVEDALADLAALRTESSTQAGAVRASTRALDLSTQRYKEGLVSFIEVVDALREQLTAERRAVQIRGQQFEATTQLIQALGGGLGPRDIH